MSKKKNSNWSNLNQVSEEENVSCGINDMNCIEGQKAEEENLSINKMNPDKENANCSITDMNCDQNN